MVRSSSYSNDSLQCTVSSICIGRIALLRPVMDQEAGTRKLVLLRKNQLDLVALAFCLSHFRKRFNDDFDRREGLSSARGTMNSSTVGVSSSP